MRRLAIVFAGALFAAHCSGGNVRDDARFSYENLYQDKYQRGNGGIIPITLERGESYSGTITRDQKYLYFSSNTAGNYDIYLRDLSDVFSIPVVTTVTNQREPSISPNGKYLVYVDDELDPDGDIVLLKVNPKKLIELYRDREQPGDEWFASRAKNLTNSEKNRIRARDANPAWSPDGKYIAYSSDLVPQKADDLGAGAGAIQNIWIMPVSNPEEKRQITTKGGVMPSFSPDGKRIVYISYQDEKSAGAVYEVEIATGATRRITSGKSLDFYPSYTPGMDAIILTRIADDTNGDGQIDRKDAGQIIRIEPDDLDTDAPLGTLDKGFVEDHEHVALTANSDHVFDSRVSNFIGGSVILAQLKGEDVNVGFIPLSGAVPVKADVRQQQAYLFEQMKKAKNKARPCLGLEQLPSAFEKSPDIEVYQALSRMRQAACDKDEAAELREFIADVTHEEQVIYRLLNDLSAISTDYADLKGIVKLPPLADTADVEGYFEKVTADKKIWNEYRDGDPGDKADFRAIFSFIRHEQAKYYIRQGKHKDAREVIRKIIRFNADYLGLDELLFENGSIDSAALPALELVYLVADKPDPALIPDYFSGLKNTTIRVRPHVRRQAERFLADFYKKQFADGGAEAQRQFLAAYPENKHHTLNALYAVVAARHAVRKEQLDEANAFALRAQALAPSGTLIYYDAEIVRGKIEEVKNGADQAIRVYAGAIAAFRDTEIPASAKNIIAKITQYHQERAQHFRTEQNDRGAAAEYQSLLDLYLSAHANKLTKEIAAGELLDNVLSLDQIALRAAADDGGDEKLLDEIVRFYDSRIDIARRFLVSEFIFGRGFLRAQLGIQRHLSAEADGLTSSEKKKVFEHFRKAEVDLNWCFFANARFADAYIMLGWMYQFIDEKREVVLEKGSGKKDREVFESLYKSYFPDYLFEKNIRLYQKTLALFGKSGSPRIKNSFHLNIANNYFLLNNYSQAEEHYAAILDAKGNPDFQFESPEQEMMFYYHFGRTLYFSGKNDAAARYLQYVENNLNSRYPIAGVPAEAQKINQARREIAYKTFALNSEYSQKPQLAIQYHQTILSEAKSVGAENPVSMSHLELARLYLRQGDLASALRHTNRAEKALEKEKEIPIPKFKLRIKWFWIYEPWTTMVGWIYKLSYDDVYIGDNHLAFELPTVNRYQLLYSIRADIYKQKGLIQDASDALAKLVTYAEKDSSKHGKETLSAAVSRRGELEFQLKNWDNAMELYATALKQAEKEENPGAALTFRKNIHLCKLRKLETENQTLADKIKTAQKNIAEVAEFEKVTIEERLKAVRKAIKEKDEPDKKDISPEGIKKVTAKVQNEIQPILFFKGLSLAHEAELEDFKLRYEARIETFDDYLARKKTGFDKFRQALKYFRGFTKESFMEVDPAFEPDLKNNSLRIKLAMNRAKILQEMSLTDESIAELKEIQERSQEFRADLEYAIASYRSYRVYEEAEMEDKVNLTPYRNLIRFFMRNQNFMRANTDLFERICNIISDRALKKRDFAEAIRTEDLRRQFTGIQMYFDDLKLYGQKEEQFAKLLTLEQKRYVLSNRIRTGRLARQNVQPIEKELFDTDSEADALKRKLRQPDRLDYHYDTFFSDGYSDAEIAQIARLGVIYALRPREDLIFVYMKNEGGKRGGLRYEVSVRADGQSDIQELEAFAQKTGARVLVLAPQIVAGAMQSEILKPLAMQTTARAAISFSENPDRAKRSIVQLVKSGSFFGLAGKNEIAYTVQQPIERVKKNSEITALSIHRNVVDYEAELVRKTVVTDNSSITPAAMFALKSNPNYAIVSWSSRDKLTRADEFRYATSIDLYFSAMGGGQVLHTFSTRKNAQSAIEAFLRAGEVTGGALLTGNAALIENENARRKLMESQRQSYQAKILTARKLREYGEAASYAEDAVSLFPEDVRFHLAAAELYLIQGSADAAARHITAAGISKTSPLADRKNYAKLLLRSGSHSDAEKFIAENPDLRAVLAREAPESEGLVQLASLSTGDIARLSAAFPWENKTDASHSGLRNKLPANLKNEELQNEICSAATDALEYALILRSCSDNKFGDASEKADRQQIKAWFAGTRTELKSLVRAEDTDFFHAISLLQAGYVSDALIYARKHFTATNLSVSENLLAFSLLRILAQRRASEADTKAIAGLLSEYGANALKKNPNTQAQFFYAILARSANVQAAGVSALADILPHKNTPWTSGVQSAFNLLYLTAISVNPQGNTLAALPPGGFPADTVVDADLKYYAETDRGYTSDIDCSRANCALLTKRHLARGENAAALNLILRNQGEPGTDTKKLAAGAFGFGEIFTDEIYEWYSDGVNLQFTRLPAFDNKSGLKIGAGRKYLAYTPRKNLFARRKIPPPRDAILVDISNGIATPAQTPASVTIAAPEPDALYSALYSEWGSGKKSAQSAFIQIKPPYHTAEGALNIYTDVVNLDNLPRLKPAAYHLFCAQGEPYGNFVTFAQAVVRGMAEQRLSVEAAYEAAFGSLKGKQASTRPLYYLYRN
ncbi:MAG: PD40 domain-containing protein [Turneriella sp.]|nr:PD40 domain-containing protein [Turneriella sp.]